MKKAESGRTKAAHHFKMGCSGEKIKSVAVERCDHKPYLRSPNEAVWGGCVLKISETRKGEFELTDED